MMVYYVLILMSAGFMLSSLNKERENRALEILMVTVTPRQLLAGKIIGLGLVGLLVNLVWLGITAALILRAAAGLFRAQYLLTGQKVTVRAISRSLFSRE
jgi:ABC-2 type transport system permease protein